MRVQPAQARITFGTTGPALGLASRYLNEDNEPRKRFFTHGKFAPSKETRSPKRSPLPD